MSLHNTENNSPTEKRERSKRIYALWLAGIPSIGPVSAGRLLNEYGSAEQIYRLPEKEVARLTERKLLTAAQTDRLREWKADSRYEPHRLYEEMTAHGIRVVFYEDEEYPKRLRNIPEPPRMLYVKGDVPVEEKPSVSIVGARLCSDYGRYTTRRFASVLAEAGVQVISGMALGIDGISHKAAMEAGGRTFAVLGCGADVCYPVQNRDIYERIPAQGGILSEYPPGTAPCAGLFPRRNR
ncbi:MAG: DNA-protecting protein DprA, partial [bacterium]|nr:DNA-protecting protein DprA [bacterium]